MKCASTYPTWRLGQRGTRLSATPARHAGATQAPRWRFFFPARKSAMRHGPARPPPAAAALVHAAGLRGAGEDRPATPRPRGKATARIGKGKGGVTTAHARRGCRRRSRTDTRPQATIPRATAPGRKGEIKRILPDQLNRMETLGVARGATRNGGDVSGRFGLTRGLPSD